MHYDRVPGRVHGGHVLRGLVARAHRDSIVGTSSYLTPVLLDLMIYIYILFGQKYVIKTCQNVLNPTTIKRWLHTINLSCVVLIL